MFCDVSRTRSYLWCILVVCGSHRHVGYGARTDPSKDHPIQSPHAGFFNRGSDPLNEYTSAENWSHETREKRDDSTATNSRKNNQNDGEAICRKKRKDRVGWSCKKVASCEFAQQLLSAKQQTVCGKEGSSQKICCPYQIDPVKAAQEKCQKYAELRYVNKTIYPQLLGYEPVNKTVLDCWNKIEPLIVGGEEAEEKEFPHMALIGNKENNQTYIDWICGGTLISPQYVLSAAHCNDPTNSLIVPTWVLLGVLAKPRHDERVGDENLYRIVKRINHPLYRPPKQEYDISLFKLERPAVFSAFIRPVCLALPPKLKLNTNTVIATGWGRTAAGEQESDTLLKVSLDRLDNGTCVETYKNETTKYSEGFDAKTMICAGRLTEEKDTCHGDSGGPIQSKIDHVDYQCMWFQEGITSLGSPYCGDKTPAVYTRVSSFLSWIQPIVWPAQDLKFS